MLLMGEKDIRSKICHVISGRLKFHSDKLGSCNRLFRKRLKTEGGRLNPDRLQVPKKLLKIPFNS